jgi:HEAT repeat protein
VTDPEAVLPAALEAADDETGSVFDDGVDTGLIDDCVATGTLPELAPHAASEAMSATADPAANARRTEMATMIKTLRISERRRHRGSTDHSSARPQHARW